jgi:hypothetical protein
MRLVKVLVLFHINMEEGSNKIYFRLTGVMESNEVKAELMVCVLHILQDNLQIFIEYIDVCLLKAMSLYA